MRQSEKYSIVIFLSFFCSTCFAVDILNVYVWKCHFCNSYYYGNDPKLFKCESKKTSVHLWILKESQMISILSPDEFG